MQYRNIFLYSVVLMVICLLYSWSQYETSGKFQSFSIKGLSGAHLFPGKDLIETIGYGYNALDIYLAVGTVQNYIDQGTGLRYGTFTGVLDYRRYSTGCTGLRREWTCFTITPLPYLTRTGKTDISLGFMPDMILCSGGLISGYNRAPI